MIQPTGISCGPHVPFQFNGIEYHGIPVAGSEIEIPFAQVKIHAS